MNIGPHRDFVPRPNSSPLQNSYVPLGFLAQQQQKPQIITAAAAEANIFANNKCEQPTAAVENGQQQQNTNNNNNNNGQPRSILKNSSADNSVTAQRAATNNMINNNNTTTGNSNNNNRKMPANNNNRTLASASNQQLAQRRRMEAQKTVAFSSTINVNETVIGKDVKGGAGPNNKNTKKIVIFSHEALALRDLFNEMKSELGAKIETLSKENDDFRREQRDLIDMIETLSNRLQAQDEQLTKLSTQLRLKNNGLEQQQRQFGTPASPALDNPIDDSDNNDEDDDNNASPANSPVFVSDHRDNLNKLSIERNCNESIRHGNGREMRLAKVNRRVVNNNNTDNNKQLSDVRMNIIMHKLEKVLQRPGGFERVERFADIWAVPSGGISQVRSLGPDSCSSNIISGEGSRTIRRSVVYQQETIHHSPARQLLRQRRDRHLQQQIKPKGEVPQQPQLPTGRQNQQQRSCWRTNRNNRRQPVISDPSSEEEKENQRQRRRRDQHHQIEEVPYARMNNTNNNNNNYRQSDPCTDEKYFQEDNNDNSSDDDNSNCNNNNSEEDEDGDNNGGGGYNSN